MFRTNDNVSLGGCTLSKAKTNVPVCDKCGQLM